MSGAERLLEAFRRAQDDGGAALVTYLCAGDPDPAETVGLMEACAEGGADIVELGVPFSDPTADGPVIQAASERALAAGARVSGVLAACAQFRLRRPDVPVVLFGYWNPWHRMGAGAAARAASAAGAAGMLVVDLPIESGEELDAACAIEGVARVLLVAPTTGDARMARVAARATGFVYLVARRGVTGQAAPDLDEVRGHVARLRRATALPIAVGFGVGDPAVARAVGAVADGVVVGSALVAAIAAARDAAGRRAAARDFTASLKRSLRP